MPIKIVKRAPYGDDTIFESDTLSTLKEAVEEMYQALAVGEKLNLQDAYLQDAYLQDAYLQDAYLQDAYLRGAYLQPQQLGLPPADPELEKRVIEAALAGPDTLEMGSWHKCETTHCLAGWAVHLSGQAGYALEKFTSPDVAGRILIPGLQHLFYVGNDEVREELAKRLVATPTQEASNA